MGFPVTQKSSADTFAPLGTGTAVTDHCRMTAASGAQIKARALDSEARTPLFEASMGGSREWVQ